jgi:hypothetical protein
LLSVGSIEFESALREKKVAMKIIDVEHYNTPQQSIWKRDIIESVARHLYVSIELSS